MVGKVSERVLLREGKVFPVAGLLRRASLIFRRRLTSLSSIGLERTDNGMRQTNWPDVTPINQKNYYTYARFLPMPRDRTKR